MTTSRLLKRILIVVMLLGFAGVAATFITYRKSFDNPEKLIAMLPKNTQLSMRSFKHTATKNGKAQWHLEAKSASLMNGKKRLVLQTPAVIFFRESGRKIFLTADTGVLQTETNNITLSGNVVARTEAYRFEADSAVYDHIRGVLTSKTPVKITSGRAELAADAMTFDLGTNTAVFNGNVKGVFSEQIS